MKQRQNPTVLVLRQQLPPQTTYIIMWTKKIRKIKTIRLTHIIRKAMLMTALHRQLLPMKPMFLKITPQPTLNKPTALLMLHLPTVQPMEHQLTALLMLHQPTVQPMKHHPMTMNHQALHNLQPQTPTLRTANAQHGASRCLAN